MSQRESGPRCVEHGSSERTKLRVRRWEETGGREPLGVPTSKYSSEGKILAQETMKEGKVKHKRRAEVAGVVRG